MFLGSSWHHTISAFLEARKLVDQSLGRERVELLDTQEIDIVDAAFLALFVKIVVDLAGTHERRGGSSNP